MSISCDLLVYHCFLTPSPSHSLTPSLPHSLIPSHPHSLTLLSPHILTPSHLHPLTSSPSHILTPSQLAQTVVDAGAIAHLAQLIASSDTKLKRQVHPHTCAVYIAPQLLTHLSPSSLPLFSPFPSSILHLLFFPLSSPPSSLPSLPPSLPPSPISSGILSSESNLQTLCRFGRAGGGGRGFPQCAHIAPRSRRIRQKEYSHTDTGDCQTHSRSKKTRAFAKKHVYNGPILNYQTVTTLSVNRQ